MAEMDGGVETVYSEYDGQVISGRTGRFVIRHKGVTLEHCTVLSPGVTVEIPQEERD